jgi:hypothetical protein
MALEHPMHVEPGTRIALRRLALVLVASCCGAFARAPYVGAQVVDPRCADRAAVGSFICTINQPNVRQRETVLPNVVFVPGDRVRVSASGCVQTGGSGQTWKRYVNPSGKNSDRFYHGLVRIPTATPGMGLVRIRDVTGQTLVVSGVGLPPSELVLRLGYEDDNYDDNGYDKHDDGTEDQCKGVGPARVSLAIVRTGHADSTRVSDRFDFNLEWTSLAPGGFALNPRWTWQRKHPGENPPDASLCHFFSDTKGALGEVVDVSPSFADCTNQTDLSHVDLPDGVNGLICGHSHSKGFRGHLNWFAVTFDGTARWDEHATDDDYNVQLATDGRPGLTNNNVELHMEFDSDETIENFSSRWWRSLKDTVEHADPSSIFRGKRAIVTGLFGLDCVHNCGSELHPVYAMAVNVRDDPADDVWAIFVRNAGNEGFCSSHIWAAPFTTYTFRLPWRPGMDSVQVLFGINQTEFEGTPGTAGPTVVFARGQGVDVTFTLPAPTETPLIDGALHLQWFGQPQVVALRRPRPPNVAAARQTTVEDEPERRLRAAVDRLPAAQRQQVAAARASAAPARRTLIRLTPGGPARRMTALAAAPTGAVRLGAKGAVATRKLARDLAQLRALCAASGDSLLAMPRSVCTRARLPR